MQGATLYLSLAAVPFVLHLFALSVWCGLLNGKCRDLQRQLDKLKAKREEQRERSGGDPGS